MKKRLISGLITASLCWLPAVQAGGKYVQGWGMSPDASFYAGGSLGAANQEAFDEGTTGAGKLFLGGRYRLIGGEVGYLKTGEAEQAGAQPRDPTLTSTTSGMYGSIMGYMPINARTELIGKLGGAYWDKQNASHVALTGVRTESHSSGASPLVGIGAQYQMYQNMHVRGEWERLFSTGEGAFETDVDLLTIGVSMSTF